MKFRENKGDPAIIYLEADDTKEDAFLQAAWNKGSLRVFERGNRSIGLTYIEPSSQPEEAEAAPAAQQLRYLIQELLLIPDHLRKTLCTICSLGGKATAEDIAQRTHRARAVESNYGNQLVLMKHLRKERKNRKTYFFVADGDAVSHFLIQQTHVSEEMTE